MLSHDKFLKDPSTKDFFEVFRFLVTQIDPQLEANGSNMEHEVPLIMRRLRYPVEVNSSKLKAISGPNTWPQLLAVLDWLTVLIQIQEELVQPVATCQLGISQIAEQERDHHLLRTMHETYQDYLEGKDNIQITERLQQIYHERIGALKDEIGRIQDQRQAMEQRLQEFRSEHDRLLELQGAPKQLELEADRLRGMITSAEAAVQREEDEAAQLEAEDRALGKEVEALQGTTRELQDQVDAQAYSKKDIERLKCERSHLRNVLEDLRADGERAEQDVWELSIKESRTAEAIGRLVRRVNETVEAADQALCEAGGAYGQELLLRIDLTEPTDALATQDLAEQHACARAALAGQEEFVQNEEATLHEVSGEERVAQEELSEKEREARRLTARLEQLAKMREDYRVWSATQLDDAQRTAETTEDAVHSAAIGTAAPSLRDAAEVDELRLQLQALKTRGAVEREQIKEQLRRGGERCAEQRQGVCKELRDYTEAMRELCDEVEASVLAETQAPIALRGSRAGSLARRGGS